MKFHLRATTFVGLPSAVFVSLAALSASFVACSGSDSADKGTQGSTDVGASDGGTSSGGGSDTGGDGDTAATGGESGDGDAAMDCTPGEVLFSSNPATQMAVDPQGGVVISHFDLQGGGNENVEVLSYDSTGGRNWAITQNGDENLADRGRGIAVGADGKIHVYAQWGGLGGRLAALDPSDGSELWFVNGPSIAAEVLLMDGPDLIGVGNKYIERRSGTDGSETWAVSTTVNVEDAVLEAGHVFITGTDDSTGDDYVGSYTTDDGSLAWETTISDAGHETPQGIAVDEEGNVWVTGRVVTADSTKAYVRKYDSEGNFLLAAEHDAGGASDRGGDIVAIPGGVLVGGQGPVTEAGWLASFALDGSSLVEVAIDRDRQNRSVSLLALGPAGTVYAGGSDTPVVQVCLP